MFAVGVVVALKIQALLNEDFVCNDLRFEPVRGISACAAPVPKAIPTLAGGLVPAALVWWLSRPQERR